MPLRILTFNIHKGFNWSNTKFTLKKLKFALSQLHPDIVFLQEVVGENQFLEHKFDHWISNQFEYLAEDLWPVFSYSKHAIFDHRHHGNVILSKLPITNEEVIDISQNKFEKRSVLFTQLEYNKELIDCYCVHLNLLHRHRRKQYHEIKQIINQKSQESKYTILAGDFNDWNKSASEHFSEDCNLSDAHKVHKGSYAKTFPAAYPIMPLDRIYVRNFKISDAHVLNNAKWKHLSDHLPLFIEVDLDDN